MKLNELYNKVVENKKIKAVVDAARKKNEQKPYVQEMYTLYALSGYARYFLGCISILTGCYFLYSTSNLPMFINILLSATIFIIVEVAKNMTLETGFSLKGKGILKGMSNGLIASGFVLLAMSVSFSFFGTERLHKITSNKKVNELKEKQRSELDSISNHYNSLIQKEESDLEEYKSNVTYKGRYNIHNTTTKQVIANSDAIISDLKMNLSEALKSSSASHITPMLELNSTQNQNKYVWVVISSIVEVFIFIIIWFRSHYLNRVFQENEIIEYYDINIEESNYIQPKKVVANITSQDKKPKQIGFSLPTEKQVTDNSDSLDSMAEMYEEEINTEIEKERKKHIIPDRPCIACKKVYTPKSKNGKCCPSCLKSDYPYIKMNISRMKKYEAKNEIENAEEKKKTVNQRISEIRNISYNENLYKEFL